MTYRRRTSHQPLAHPTWARYALGSGILGCLGTVAFVLTPVLTIALAQATAMHDFNPPVAAVAVPVLAGYALAAGLLTLTALTASRALAWLLAIAAVTTTISASTIPILSVS